MSYNRIINVALLLYLCMLFIILIVFEYLAKQYIEGMNQDDQEEENQPQVAGKKHYFLI